MKKITISFIVLALTLTVNAQVYLNETFAGSFGALGTTPQATYTPDASEWSCLQYEYGASTAPSRDIEETALTYSNDGGEYILSGVGKTVNNQYHGTSGNFWHVREFSTTGINEFYVTFIVELLPGAGSNATLLGSYDTYGTGAANRPLVQRKKASDNISFYTSTNNTTGGSTSTPFTTEQELPDKFLVVWHVNCNSSTAALYINPEIGGSKPVTPTCSDAQASMKKNQKFIYLRSNGGTINYFKMSGIRVTGSWAEAVAAKLVAPAVGTASELISTGFTANWTPVDNATAYEVNVYEGESLVKTETVSGQSTSSTEITELVSNKTYVYTVTAISNGTYSNSDPVSSPESDASEEILLMTTDIQPVGVDNMNISVSVNDAGQIVIVKTNHNAFQPTATIFNVQGQRIIEQRLNDGETTIDRVFTAGVYIVKAGNKTVKIAVK